MRCYCLTTMDAHRHGAQLKETLPVTRCCNTCILWVITGWRTGQDREDPQRLTLNMGRRTSSAAIVSFCLNLCAQSHHGITDSSYDNRTRCSYGTCITCIKTSPLHVKWARNTLPGKAQRRESQGDQVGKHGIGRAGRVVKSKPQKILLDLPLSHTTPSNYSKS